MLKKMGTGMIMICVTLALFTVSSAMMYKGYDNSDTFCFFISKFVRHFKQQ